MLQAVREATRTGTTMTEARAERLEASLQTSDGSQMGATGAATGALLSHRPRSAQSLLHHVEAAATSLLRDMQTASVSSQPPCRVQQ